MSIAAAASLLRRSCGVVSRYYRGFRRSFATQTPAIGNQRRRQKQQFPWLMLSSPDNPESRYLYELTGDDRKPIAFNREIHLPEIAGHLLIGSSQGYLFSVDETAEIHATDPLTGARLSVPSTSALPSIAGVIRDPAGNISHYVIDDRRESPLDNIKPETFIFERNRCGGEISLLSFLDPNKVDIYDLDSKIMYYTRAILSPSHNTAVVIHEAAYRYVGGRPAFAEIGSSASASASWNALYSPSSYHFQDVIFHQGRLHAIGICGTLVVFNLDDPLGRPFVSPEGPLDEKCIMRRSLVESPDGEDLFLVFRGESDDDDDGDSDDDDDSRRTNYFKVFGDDDDDGDSDDDDDPPRTDYFKVFKLDKSNYKWNRVSSIGDVAMFLGSNHSVAISATHFSAGAGGGGIIRPNSIYFTDDYRIGDIDDRPPHWVDTLKEKPHWVGDTGVYNLGDDSVEYYELSDGRHKFNWPPPIWFMPTAT